MPVRRVITSQLLVWPVIALVFMEWLFFVSKPSLFTHLSALEDFRVLLISIAFACLPLLVLAGFLILLSRFAENARLNNWINYFSALVATVLCGFLALLLVDNFTYTVLGLGITDTQGFYRYAYAALFLIVLWRIFRRINTVASGKQPESGFQPLAMAMTALVILAALATAMTYTASSPVMAGRIDTANLNRVNVIVLSSDGINAANMSAYGYGRETTPVIDQLLAYSVKYVNHFTNSGNTSGSITSMLNGKHPTTTRMIYPPDILRGKDMYQHLPGILRKLGYTNIDIGIRHYADAVDINMREAFDEANFRVLSDSLLGSMLPANLRYSFGQEFYFLELISGRIAARIKHLFGLANMADAFRDVTQQKGFNLTRVHDMARLERAKDFINEARQPYFINLHFMGSHGPTFYPVKPRYSKNQQQSQDWSLDFYDDAVGDFDFYVGEITQLLQAREMLKNTLLIITTDHPMQYVTHDRIPLVIFYPGKRFAKEDHHNTQRLDIAPTILDFIGVPIPDWMAGQSLIRQPYHEQEIVAVSTQAKTRNEQTFLMQSSGHDQPPFYSMDTISMILCDRHFELDLHDNKLITRTITGHSRPCEPNAVPDDDQARSDLVQYLLEQGYDVSSIH